MTLKPILLHDNPYHVCLKKQNIPFCLNISEFISFYSSINFLKSDKILQQNKAALYLDSIRKRPLELQERETLLEADHSTARPDPF